MLFAICGHKRHGKDSIADVLVAHFGFRKDQFARPMKEACSAIFGWSAEYIENEKETIDPRWGISPRQALMLLGTEWGQYMLSGEFPEFKRITGRKLWARRTLDLYNPSENLVISDMRFPHEAEEVRERGGKIIRVIRPTFPTDLSHESEKAVGDIQADIYVCNGGTLQDLRDGVIRDVDKW